jgi:ABC-type transport system substrate-binding protein
MDEFVQHNLGAIGIKVKFNVNTWPEFSEKLRTKKAQIWGVAWGADYPDAQNFFQLFYGKNVSPGPNGANYVNPAFDKLYEQAMKMPIGIERTDVYKKMRDILAEDTPWVFNIHREGYYLSHPWVKNVKYNAFVSIIPKYVKIDLAKKKEMKPKL